MAVNLGNGASYDDALSTPKDIVRLLLNDTAAPAVFNDKELDGFLTLEGGAVKLAAAQAIDTNADNEALASKVLRTQDRSVDGAKLADALRKRAEALREQHYAGLEDADDGFYFGVVDFPDPEQHGPELASHPSPSYWIW